MKTLRILFFGSPSICLPTLEALNINCRLVGIVTIPDKPIGRGLQLQPSEVKKYALSQNIPLWQPEQLTDPQFITDIQSLKIDIGVVFAFRKLPIELYQIPIFGTFNIHTSLLPQYRGAAPIQRAIMNGETKTGLTTFLLNENIDKGNILLQKPIEISPTMNTGELYTIMQALAPEITLETIKGLLDKTLKGVVQTNSFSLAPKLQKKDNYLDLEKNIIDIYNHIRGMTPTPGVWANFELDSKSFAIKIYKADYILEKHNFILGQAFIRGQKLLIACKNGYIIPIYLQLAGKKKVMAIDFINGLA